MSSPEVSTVPGSDAQLIWASEFRETLPLTPLRLDFAPRTPAVRSLSDEELASLVEGGAALLPDDCTAVIRAGQYGAAIRVPSRLTISGVSGAWQVDSEPVTSLQHGRVPIAEPFLGSRFVKVVCGHHVLYSHRHFSLMLTQPPNAWESPLRVWTGLQAVPYRDVPERTDGLRLFNTNVIVEPVTPCVIEPGSTLAVLYLLPRRLRIIENAAAWR